MDHEAAQRVVQVDPELSEFLKLYPSAPQPRDIGTLRAQLRPIEDFIWTSPAPDNVEEYIQIIAVSDGFVIQARVHRPKLASRNSPLIVYFHAGGYCVGSSTLAMPLCRSLVQRLNAVVVNVDYRLAPEYPFPTPINDCWDALQWVARNATELRANPTKGFIVAGESSGGNSAAVLAHLARDNKLSPPLTGQFLSMPSCLPACAVPERYAPFYHSWDQALAVDASPLFNLDMTLMLDKGYCANTRSRMFATFNDRHGHADLPPAYFQVCGIDPVRDEGLLYEKVLREEHGVKTKLNLYEGLPHAFWQVYPRLKKSQIAREDMFKGFEWLLGQSSD